MVKGKTLQGEGHGAFPSQTNYSAVYKPVDELYDQ